MDRDPSERLRRAIKENNLLLVRRLLTRTDMRNPDPGPGRYTSLAWAGICVCEDIFEYLLGLGHDDEELSRDMENNTIILLLAGVQSGAANPNCRPSLSELDVQESVLRMARLYYERYPFLIDWANIQGKTALHVAALKGNEEFVRMFCDLGADFDLADTLGNTPLHYASAWGHVQIVQLLIERGCQFAAKNNQGFTASDYAYSYSTMNALQETARMQFENNKRARRHIFAQAAARGAETRKKGWESDVDDFSPVGQAFKSREVDRNKALPRLRSGSGTTNTSDSATDPEASGSGSQNALSKGSKSRPHLSSLSSSNSSSHPQNSNGSLIVPSPAHHNRTTSSASAAAVLIHPTSTPNSNSAPRSPRPPTPPPKSNTPLQKPPDNLESSLSPIAVRMREKDADAMAQYYLRQTSTSTNGKEVNGLATQPPPAVSPQQPASKQPPEPSKPPPSEHHPGLSFPSLRLLRPSISAASLRSMSKAQASATKKPTEERSSRFRSTTLEKDSPAPSKEPLPSNLGETRPKRSIDLSRLAPALSGKI